MGSDTNERDGGAAGLVAVPEVLTTVSHEIRIVSDTVKDLQELIGNLVLGGTFGKTQSLYELQCLDRLYQSLDAISDFLGGISKASSPDWKVDVERAAAAVKIAEISNRLNGAKASSPATAAGELDEFEIWSMTG